MRDQIRDAVNMLDVINKIQFAVDPNQTVAEFLGAITELPREVATPFVQRAFVFLEAIGIGHEGSIDECLDSVYANTTPTPDYFKSTLNMVKFMMNSKTLSNQMTPKAQAELFDFCLEVIEAGDPEKVEFNKEFKERREYQMARAVVNML